MGQEQDTTKRNRWMHLSERERYKIEGMLRAKMTAKEIAENLGRNRRTIEREIARGSVIQRDSQWRDEYRYLADAGQRIKEERSANKGRSLKIGADHALVRHIEQRIGQERWSPDAVTGEIRQKGLLFSVSICTKTLYSYIDAGLFLNISNKDLPVKKKKRRRKYRTVRKTALNNTHGRSIEERTKEINDRDEYGHWEMDCVVGKGKACLLVLTERKHRSELIFKLKAKTQEEVVKRMDRLERRYRKRFPDIFKSITTDNGVEFLDMKGIERSCIDSGRKRTVCYYAHPYSSWERGSNENANRLIRRFVPKGSDIGKLTNKDVKRIELWINNYPRKIFGYKSSEEMAA